MRTELTTIRTELNATIRTEVNNAIQQLPPLNAIQQRYTAPLLVQRFNYPQEHFATDSNQTLTELVLKALTELEIRGRPSRCRFYHFPDENNRAECIKIRSEEDWDLFLKRYSENPVLGD
eukprot:TRINITY_DN1951_c0_g1_i2.p1 TRINITY_DN1951_c0_g1~~TRINITY_DN1951_c0_g1_i2.p1  ORF type:complete len:120 (-),score=13.18 TRINITY_DN1951_c0_g1_i2:98-457(-)